MNSGSGWYIFDGVRVQVDPCLVIWSLQNYCHMCGVLTPSARLQEPPNSIESTRVNAQACSLSVQFVQEYQESSSSSIVLGEN